MSSIKKVVSFDVDGTLTASKSPITEEMVNLVKELIKKTLVVAISGANFNQFKTQLISPFFTDEFLSIHGRNLILLPTSGSQRYEYDSVKKEWQMTDKEPLDEKVKDRVKSLFQQIIKEGEKYEIPQNPFGNIVEDRDTQITFSGRGQLAPIEEKKAWDPDKRKREKIRDALAPELPEVSLFINAYSSIDVVPKGFNKAVGVTRLLDSLKLGKSDVVFIGDGLFPGGNDYSMQEAGFETVAVKGPEETEKVIRNML